MSFDSNCSAKRLIFDRATNFMRQFRDPDSRELKKLSANQFMEIWSHYDRDGNGYIEGTELDGFLREFVSSANFTDISPDMKLFVLLVALSVSVFAAAMPAEVALAPAEVALEEPRVLLEGTIRGSGNWDPVVTWSWYLHETYVITSYNLKLVSGEATVTKTGGGPGTNWLSLTFTRSSNTDIRMYVYDYEILGVNVGTPSAQAKSLTSIVSKDNENVIIMA